MMDQWENGMMVKRKIFIFGINIPPFQYSITPKGQC